MATTTLSKPKKKATSNTNGGSSSSSSNIKSNTNKKQRKRRNPKQQQQNQNQQQQQPYPEHLTRDVCNQRYDNEDKLRFVRGTLRCVNQSTAFVACDRGRFTQDILIPDTIHRNRALHGDTVYVEVLMMNDGGDNAAEEHFIPEDSEEDDSASTDSVSELWQDDAIQMSLYNPQVPLVRPKQFVLKQKGDEEEDTKPAASIASQPRGRVVHVVYPQSTTPSELHPNQQASSPLGRGPPQRTIVGSIKKLNDQIILLTPCQSGLVQFKCRIDEVRAVEQALVEKENTADAPSSPSDKSTIDWNQVLVKAVYTYGSWKPHHTQWPPCTRLQLLGNAFDIEHQIEALLQTHGVDHGPDFSPTVLQDVEEAVASGRASNGQWEPTPEMCQGRRDYRTSRRIFTIDPTTAKDLDDALHIMEHPDGTIEVGVHIADVSHFVQPGSAVDREAIRRATTVYLVDRTIPMLPRMLCEVACSLNENVDRLAFSCVWRMHRDGTLVADAPVWYGRTVIRSCARLDYATAQRIIDASIATDDEQQWRNSTTDWWIPARRPSHPNIRLSDVAADVRLMHTVAMARRRKRFANGSLALHSVKLTFELENNQDPMLAAPYPMRDSNRVVEEYMLLANYFTAQRLITHAGGRAVLRRHPPPNMDALEKAVALAAAAGFHLDIASSESLQRSINALAARSDGDNGLTLHCVTHMLTLPMQAAVYFSADSEKKSQWSHYALHMPYYTHFTSPIRRYPDILVHRMLQATLDDTVSQQPSAGTLQQHCEHCSEKQMASKEAQQRCDRVFLSLYTKRFPIPHEMAVVVSVGQTAFTALVPRLGCEALLYLEEHKDMLTWTTNAERAEGEERKIFLHAKEGNGSSWKNLKVQVFTKMRVTIVCKEKAPVDVKLRFEGPWGDASS